MDRVHVTDVIAYLAQGSECKRETASSEKHPSAELVHSFLTSTAHSQPFLGRQHKSYRVINYPVINSKYFFRGNNCAPFFKEIPSFFRGVTPSKTPAAPQPLNSAFPLGNGGVLRSEEGGGIQEGRGRWGGGKKEGKKDAQKVLSFRGNNFGYYGILTAICRGPFF